jgi:hypothetical protein
MPLLPNLIVLDPDAYLSDPEDDENFYAFDQMRGVFQPKQQQLEGIVRPGHDGESTRETGVRGDPFAIRTTLYVPTRQDAVNAIAEYIALVDGNPYNVIQNGQSWGYFKILKVAQAGEPIPCASVIGTLIDNPEIKHVVDFTILSTDPPPTP